MGKSLGTPRSDRTSFLNNSKSAAISETIRKEERAVYRLLEKQMELGRIKLPSEEPELAACPSQADMDPVQLSRLLGSTGDTAEEEEDASGIRKDRLQDISRSIWSVANPGYLACETNFCSVAKSDYAWREADVQVMKSQGELDSTHHRKRDGFTVYAEAALRNTHLQRRGSEAHTH